MAYGSCRDKDKLCGQISALTGPVFGAGGKSHYLQPLSLVPGMHQWIRIEEKSQMMCCASCEEELLHLWPRQAQPLSPGTSAVLMLSFRVK